MWWGTVATVECLPRGGHCSTSYRTARVRKNDPRKPDAVSLICENDPTQQALPSVDAAFSSVENRSCISFGLVTAHEWERSGEEGLAVHSRLGASTYSRNDKSASDTGPCPTLKMPSPAGLRVIDTRCPVAIPAEREVETVE